MNAREWLLLERGQAGGGDSSDHGLYELSHGQTVSKYRCMKLWMFEGCYEVVTSWTEGVVRV